MTKSSSGQKLKKKKCKGQLVISPNVALKTL